MPSSTPSGWSRRPCFLSPWLIGRVQRIGDGGRQSDCPVEVGGGNVGEGSRGRKEAAHRGVALPASPRRPDGSLRYHPEGSTVASQNEYRTSSRCFSGIGRKDKRGLVRSWSKTSIVVPGRPIRSGGGGATRRGGPGLYWAEAEQDPTQSSSRILVLQRGRLWNVGVLAAAAGAQVSMRSRGSPQSANAGCVSERRFRSHRQRSYAKEQSVESLIGALFAQAGRPGEPDRFRMTTAVLERVVYGEAADFIALVRDHGVPAIDGQRATRPSLAGKIS